VSTFHRSVNANFLVTSEKGCSRSRHYAKLKKEVISIKLTVTAEALRSSTVLLPDNYVKFHTVHWFSSSNSRGLITFRVDMVSSVSF